MFRGGQGPGSARNRTETGPVKFGTGTGQIWNQVEPALNRGWDRFRAGSIILELWTGGFGSEPAGLGSELVGSGSFYKKKIYMLKIQKMQVTTLYKILYNFLLLVVYFVF